jgi:hypothetical protein
MGDGPTRENLTDLTRSGTLSLEELVQVTILSSQVEVPSDWIVVTCTTCIESHFDRVLNCLIEASGAGHDRFSNSLLENSRDEIFKTWDSRLKWLDSGFAVSIAGDRPIQEYRTLVELRNAIVHGQGSLTEIQLRNFQRLLDLKRRMTRLMEVQFHGHKVLLPPYIGPKVIQICRSAIVCLDTALLQAHPGIEA